MNSVIYYLFTNGRQHDSGFDVLCEQIFLVSLVLCMILPMLPFPPEPVAAQRQQTSCQCCDEVEDLRDDAAPASCMQGEEQAFSGLGCHVSGQGVGGLAVPAE